MTEEEFLLAAIFDEDSPSNGVNTTDRFLPNHWKTDEDFKLRNHIDFLEEWIKNKLNKNFFKEKKDEVVDRWK